MNPDFISQDIKKEFPQVRLARVGSSIIPNVKPKDFDILVCVAKSWEPLVKYLKTIKFEIEGNREEVSEDYPEDAGFISMRRENVNFIITCDSLFFDTFKKASGLCKALRLKNRKDRVLVHKAILRQSGSTNSEEKRAKHVIEGIMMAASTCTYGHEDAAKDILWNLNVTHEQASNSEVSEYDFNRISKLMEWE